MGGGFACCLNEVENVCLIFKNKSGNFKRQQESVDTSEEVLEAVTTKGKTIRKKSLLK